eukprot:TRINITY_DN3983_c2_g1_i1.p1 TRINITY_DN3983_c2_g1~~TRINITY_DN3983_c2_g1_i1.p1  ORF type:complete len:239 (-),score=39.50 TRINITY_DN3983_c2_g1_i1:222-938(-)
MRRHVMMCELVVNERIIATTSTSSPVVAGVPRVTSMHLSGGPTFTDPIELKVEYCGGVQRTHLVQWYRMQDSGLLPISGANSLVYRPTCEDYSRQLFVDYTPFRDDGKMGLTARMAVPREYLNMDDAVRQAVESIVRKGQEHFEVTALSGPKQALVATTKNLKIRSKSGKTIQKKSWSDNLRWSLVPFDSLHLLITMDDILHPLVCESARQRDIIVLSLATFATLERPVSPSSPRHPR